MLIASPTGGRLANPGLGTAGVVGEAGLRFHNPDMFAPEAAPPSGIGDKVRLPIVPIQRSS